MPTRLMIIAYLACLWLARPVSADPVDSLTDGRSGRIEFNSLTPANYLQLIRRTAPKATVVGTLTLPPGNERVPAMVIAHGSGGVRDIDHGWASFLNENGIAGFVVDTFAPRGINDTVANQSVLSVAANVADAFSALRLLATHPRIDPNRIGVMGFSRGGDVAVKTAFDALRRGVIDGPLQFAVHAPFYPPCGTRFVSERLTKAPMLFLLGEVDDYTPSKPCLGYVEWFKSKGVAAESVMYAGANHGFDGVRAPRYINSAQNCRHCDVIYDLDKGEFRRTDTNTVMVGDAITAYYRENGSVGATVGGDHAARTKARADLAAYLKRVFRL